MNSGDWAVLIPAIAALLTAIAGYLKAHTTNKKLSSHIQSLKKIGS